MAAFLEGLTWGSHDSLGETRAGMPIYSGTAHGLAEWKFKLQNKRRVSEATVDEEQKAIKLAQLISQVIEGLSDDALRIAMDMSEEELAAPGAITTLVENNSRRSKRRSSTSSVLSHLDRCAASRASPSGRTQRGASVGTSDFEHSMRASV